MNESKNPRETPRMKQKRRRRGASVAVVLAFVAAIAIVGTYTFKDYRESQRELEFAKAEAERLENQAKEQSESANTDQIINEESQNLSEKNTVSDELMNEEIVDGSGSDSANSDTESMDGQSDMSQQTDTNAAETAGNGKSVSFSENNKLLWPVEGTLLMNYSMDKTVYFSTLDQFKYNPALVIEGEKGDQVISSAPGIVKSIDKTAQTGTTVNVDIGSGYELFYGQLSDVKVKTGDYVDSKTVLGYVSDPTIYYSVEGPNVYFEMRKDGQPVNPMDYLVE